MPIKNKPSISCLLQSKATTESLYNNARNLHVQRCICHTSGHYNRWNMMIGNAQPSPFIVQ